MQQKLTFSFLFQNIQPAQKYVIFVCNTDILANYRPLETIFILLKKL